MFGSFNMSPCTMKYESITQDEFTSERPMARKQSAMGRLRLTCFGATMLLLSISNTILVWRQYHSSAEEKQAPYCTHTRRFRLCVVG
jgi:hypothetical protein